MMNLKPEAKTSGAEEEQLRVLVQRMEDFIADYLLQAEKMKIVISSQQVLDLVDRALLKAQKVEGAIPYAKTVEGYFLDGMLEDLNCQPESIFEQVTTPEGETIYGPLSDKVWIACLKKLRLTLIQIVSE
jgi:Asp-tRNA(Asn)/Glu-tRNA(Gln) amidotransferase B subunit